LGDFQTTNFYTGYVNGEAKSHVICYFETSSTSNSTLDMASKNPLTQPLIYAQIQIQKERDENETSTQTTIYYIEPSIKLNGPEEDLKGFKYLVYKTDDIDSDVISNNVFK
jgi:hypothetical protein